MLALVVFGLGCGTSIRRDYLLQPQKAGTRLTGFGFVGPGLRATVDNRADLEEGNSQLRNRIQGDVNYGYAEGSAHVDLRWLIFTFGGSAGYRYSWHNLEFTPGADGLDHGESELNLDARSAKDEDDDYGDDSWFWGEGRFSMVAPWENVLVLSTVAYRHEDRSDQSYSWEYATVYDNGGLIRWESAILLHHRHVGFIGPVARYLNVARTENGKQERAGELQYGIAAGTTPGWSDAPHALLLRVYSSTDIELMGTQIVKLPVQLTAGYQQDFEL
jgi:hypothetical protein